MGGFLVANAQTTARDTTQKKSGFRFTSLSLIYGGFWGNLNNGKGNDLANLQSIAGGPNSIFADTNTRFNDYYSEWNNVSLWGNFDVLKRSSEVYQTVGIGLNYYNSSAVGFYNSTFYSKPIDTLFSNINDSYAVVDTFVYRQQSGHLSTRNLLGQVNYKISSNPRRKFSFFASANLGFGGTITSQYRFYDYTNSGRELGSLIDTLNPMPTQYFHFHNYHGFEGAEKESSKKVPGYFVLKPYITVGVNYRLSKYINVLRHMAVTLEARVGSQHLFFKDRVFSGLSHSFAIGLNYTFKALEKPKKK